MAIKSIKQARNLGSKRVLVRFDFNVPIKKKKVVEDTRLVESLPTLKFLIEKKAKVIIVTHLGRPEGRKVAALKLNPVADRLGQLLKRPVIKLDKFKGPSVELAIKKMRSGQVILLENIRFSAEENGNKGSLARELADLADIFVQDGFAVAHRGDASVVGIAKFLPSYAGLLLDKEIKGLTKVIREPKSPFVVVLGGAKMETKLPVMKNLIPRADYMLVGGGIMNTYLQALGYGVGASLVDKDFLKEALMYGKKKKVVKPVDLIVGTADGKHHRHVLIGKQPQQICRTEEAIFDIGPATIRLFATYIKQAQTLVWNGAMGYFEQKPYDIGTLSVARLVAARAKGRAYGVIGGGETLQAMELVRMGGHVDLISTGGGAMLQFLAGEELPGVKALDK